jgi:TonB family protein
MAHVATQTAPNPQDMILPSLFGDAANPYEVRPFNFLYSLLAHVAVAALALYVASIGVRVVQNPHAPVSEIFAPPLSLPPAFKRAGGGGGGGARELTPASKGTPPPSSLNQIAPPTVHVAEHPILPAPTAVIVPNVPLPTSSTIGSLKGVLGPASDGTGSGSGIGTGTGGGDGSGNGRGLGPGSIAGIGDGVYRVGGGVSSPKVIKEVEPEFSEEARKAKYTGTVLVRVVIGPDGNVRSASVLSPVGMGLDEKAVEAAKQWKFDPARKDGRPVSVYAQIEVNFQLY